MSQGGFTLPLAPPETLGRRFQYTLFSLDPSLVEVDPLRGEAYFKDPSDYVSLVEMALEALEPIKVDPVKGCKPKTVGPIDCCSLHSGPRLYTAGVKDSALLEKAGFTSCMATTRKGQARVSWNHAAVSYAEKVVEKGGPLGGSTGDLPWLAKATLFSKIRGAGGGFEPPRRRGRAGQAPGYTRDTLGSILLGGALSLVYVWNLKGASREIFLVPDFVNRNYHDLRSLVVGSDWRRGVMNYAARIASELPVSFEVAVAVALATELARKYGTAWELSDISAVESLEKAASLVTVAPQQRPMVVSVIPLSIVIYMAYHSSTLYALSDVVSSVIRPKSRVSEALQGVRDVVGGCINSMYLQAAYRGWSDHLSGCIRSLITAADQAENKGMGELAKSLRGLAERLTMDYARLVKGAARL